MRLRKTLLFATTGGTAGPAPPTGTDTTGAGTAGAGPATAAGSTAPGINLVPYNIPAAVFVIINGAASGSPAGAAICNPRVPALAIFAACRVPSASVRRNLGG